jgi:ABC-type Zn2+ transport system substrate-binding protein/surface adhesin
LCISQVIKIIYLFVLFLTKIEAMWERKQQLKEEIRQLCYQKYLLTLASLVVQQFLQENDSEEEESAQEEEDNEDEEEEDDEDDDEDGDE